jgi:hypothetical protein
MEGIVKSEHTTKISEVITKVEVVCLSIWVVYEESGEKEQTISCLSTASSQTCAEGIST